MLAELHTAMKTYHLFYVDHCIGQQRKDQAEQAKHKYEGDHPKKVPTSRRFKQLTKDYNKRYNKYCELWIRAMRARNEYLLCVDAANAALTQYFTNDMPDLIDVSPSADYIRTYSA